VDLSDCTNTVTTTKISAPTKLRTRNFLSSIM